MKHCSSLQIQHKAARSQEGMAKAQTVVKTQKHQQKLLHLVTWLPDQTTHRPQPTIQALC